jgi:L-iditol 2-dehydrogenase
VIEAAGSPRAFEEGVRMARNGGAYIIAGHYTNTGDSTINAHEHINRKHLEIRGCWGSEVGHFLRALRALDAYRDDIPFREIGAETYGLSQINDALAVAESMRIPKALVDPWA